MRRSGSEGGGWYSERQRRLDWPAPLGRPDVATVRDAVPGAGRASASAEPEAGRVLAVGLAPGASAERAAAALG